MSGIRDITPGGAVWPVRRIRPVRPEEERPPGERESPPSERDPAEPSDHELPEVPEQPDGSDGAGGQPAGDGRIDEYA